MLFLGMIEEINQTAYSMITWRFPISSPSILETIDGHSAFPSAWAYGNFSELHKPVMEHFRLHDVSPVQ